MCGISGIFSDDGYPSVFINDMVNIMTHRGPDDCHTQTPGEYKWLGHNRLSIIDLSYKGSQPMQSHRYVLTMNGEIYNYKELESYIEVKGGNDCSVFLNYVERYDINQSLRDINGMFAFGLYDKVNDLLHLAVDRFGQKPLYYYHSDKFFAFASTPNALLWIKDKWKINQEALNSYWLLGGIMGENSLFDGIKRLNAAEHLTFDPKTGKCWKEKYWEPKFQSNTSGIEDLVLDSIKRVKVSDVPVYIFLSGGIDSTLVASQCEGMNAIHLDGPERKYAEQVAKKYNINLHIVDPVECDPVEAMKDYVTKSGEPAMAALIPWMVSRETAKLAKCAITANGADELFFGYDRTKQEIRSEQIKHIYRSIDIPWIGDFTLSPGRQLELRDYVQFDLNQTLDRASMCHSLEVRSPFLDHRLVEMALSIPENIHRNGYGNKSILKKMLKNMGFDDPFFQRPKVGFSLFKQPKGLAKLQSEALQWCIKEGFLKCNPLTLNGRDLRYLEASSFSFRVWYQVHEKLIN